VNPYTGKQAMGDPNRYLGRQYQNRNDAKISISSIRISSADNWMSKDSADGAVNTEKIKKQQTWKSGKKNR
jgi:hypothetical protein